MIRYSKSFIFSMTNLLTVPSKTSRITNLNSLIINYRLLQTTENKIRLLIAHMVRLSNPRYKILNNSLFKMICLPTQGRFKTKYRNG